VVEVTMKRWILGAVVLLLFAGGCTHLDRSSASAGRHVIDGATVAACIAEQVLCLGQESSDRDPTACMVSHGACAGLEAVGERAGAFLYSMVREASVAPELATPTPTPEATP